MREIRIVCNLEICALISFVLGVQMYAIGKLRRTLPGSVMRRSIRVASPYLVAFIASYGLWVFSSLFPFHLLPRGGATVHHKCRFVGRCMFMLNGLFNFIA